ncbi:ribose-phosphate pyrophosphokinase [Christensenellaceae bacterium NSJ-44]|uniref:Ribose-phosphate pyrophosphokinase n=1 Tax=Luoshenia tenuis TaxID=2763654 RepID=A0A926HJJ9_9FIRM|nr:ribose-phosphate pyrophosphokinase [Luoshenia tenuis]MBC8529967.1 ribose-phosphate pyrophosphokinase [Luoshenia tenuis]
MITHGKNIVVFSGNSNPGMAADIARLLDRPLGESKVGRFSDGEISVNIGQTVRGMDVFLVQSTCTPVNENLMELLIMIDAFRRASAGRITAVIPYFGYARQDRKTKPRDPITAKLVADLITAAGADRVLTMDLHAAQIQGFFDIPVDHLRGAPALAAYYVEKGYAGEDLVVVSPDLGSVTRARNFANRLGARLAIVDKRRPRPNVSEVMNIIGEVKGCRAILVDDLLDTGGTLVKAAEALMKMGAKEVSACCTHGVLSGEAVSRIAASPLRELVITDTVPLGDKHCDKIVVLSVASVFSQAIERIYNDLPVSTLYE